MQENWATTGTITKIPTRVLAPRVGGTLIFSYIRRHVGSGHFLGSKL